MAMKKQQKKIIREIKGLKLSPVDIKSAKKDLKSKPEVSKTEEQKRQEEEQEEQEIDQKSNFKESLSSSSKIIRPALSIEHKEEKPENLEQFAASQPSTATQSETPSYTAKTTYTTSPSSQYETNASEKYGRREASAVMPISVLGESTRPQMFHPLMREEPSEGRIRLAVEPATMRRDVESFAREQEKYTLERQESQKLPFERKRRKTEIF